MTIPRKRSVLLLSISPATVDTAAIQSLHGRAVGLIRPHDLRLLLCDCLWQNVCHKGESSKGALSMFVFRRALGTTSFNPLSYRRG